MKQNNFFDSDFPSPCFDVPKASNFTFGGVRLWRQFRTPSLAKKSFSYCELINLLRNGIIVRCLWENKKTSEKSVSREARSPELTSQSFPVSCFWSRGFVPHRKWNLMLLVHENTGKENRYGKNFFATLISTLGRFNRANKKICHIHFKIFRFGWVLGFVIDYAWISKLLRDAAFTWRSREPSCWVKKLFFRDIWLSEQFIY